MTTGILLRDRRGQASAAVPRGIAFQGGKAAVELYPSAISEFR